MTPTDMGLLTCGHQEAAVQLVVGGQKYLADFTGHTTFNFDQNQLAQYMQGAANLVEMLVQADVNNGVGAVIGTIAWIMDPGRVPHPAP